MPSLLSIEDLQVILKGHAGRIGRSVWPTWKRYLAIDEADRLAFDLAAEAKIINRYMINCAKREFAGVPGLSFFEECGFMLGIQGWTVGVDGQAICRFKKLDEDGRSRAYPTSRQKAIKANDIEKLPGMPPDATFVDIGPVINGLRTGFRDVQAIRVADTRFIRSFGEEAEAVLPMPQGLIGPTTPRFNISKRHEMDGSGEKE